MVKESNMSIFSIMLGLAVVLFNISNIIDSRYNILISILATLIACIALILSIAKQKKITAKRDKYIFSIIVSIISFVFNLFLLVSLFLFMS